MILFMDPSTAPTLASVSAANGIDFPPVPINALKSRKASQIIPEMVIDCLFRG